ncbi:MAG: hypothetical protein CBC06_002390 [bacterium TMED46]|nr:MAG: hypothetical protein CBC06_002390 [bacterium TMED46]
MVKKIKLVIQFITISLIMQSCSFDDNTINYEEQLVVFASINAGFPVYDTVFVSRTAEVNESVDSDDLYIENADVRLINISDGSELKFYSLGSGRYYPIDMTIQNLDSVFSYWVDYVISSGTTYRLVVTHEDNSVIAETNVPEKIEITSAEMSEFQCPDESTEPVSIIDVNNLENFTFEQMLSLSQNPLEYIEANNINVDSVEFKIGDCYTKSFASAPMFGVDYNQDDYNTIQIISNALESDVSGLEPFDDENQNGVFDEGENFSDRNRNGSRDSCYINLIYSEEKGLFDNDSLDYNSLANIWKEPLKRGSADGTWRENSPYRNNPWLWNVDISPSPIMWLYFDYYGYYMMTFKSTSDSYFNYFKGDPVGQNIYLLPDSNFEGGLGVFYSSSSTSFIVRVIATAE